MHPPTPNGVGATLITRKKASKISTEIKQKWSSYHPKTSISPSMTWLQALKSLANTSFDVAIDKPSVKISLEEADVILSKLSTVGSKPTLETLRTAILAWKHSDRVRRCPTFKKPKPVADQEEWEADDELFWSMASQYASVSIADEEDILAIAYHRCILVNLVDLYSKLYDASEDNSDANILLPFLDINDMYPWNEWQDAGHIWRSFTRVFERQILALVPLDFLDAVKVSAIPVAAWYQGIGYLKRLRPDLNEAAHNIQRMFNAVQKCKGKDIAVPRYNIMEVNFDEADEETWDIVELFKEVEAEVEHPNGDGKGHGDRAGKADGFADAAPISKSDAVSSTTAGVYLCAPQLSPNPQRLISFGQITAWMDSYFPTKIELADFDDSDPEVVRNLEPFPDFDFSFGVDPAPSDE